MKNYGESVKINHNSNWPYIPDYLYRILIIGSSGSGKNNVSLNLMKHQRPNVGKIYSYVKDPLESMYRMLISRREKVGIKQEKIQAHFLIILKQLMMSGN